MVNIYNIYRASTTSLNNKLKVQENCYHKSIDATEVSSSKVVRQEGPLDLLLYSEIVLTSEKKV